MEPNVKLRELLPDYISGRIDPGDRSLLESELEKSSQLKEELEDLKRLSSGLTVIDSISKGHINSETLATYATTPDQIDSDTQEEIRQHVDSCEHCREELLICQPVAKARETAEPEISESWITSTVTWVLSPQIALRPAVAVLMVAFLALPSVYFALRAPADGKPAIYVLSPVSRSDISASDFDIDYQDELIMLTFDLPVIEDRQYSVELYDNSGQFIFSLSLEPTGNSFALEVPTSYLEDGIYTISVKESDGENSVEELDSFRFSVHFVE